MTQLKITGMTCESCAVHVKEALEQVPGVRSAEVSYANGNANLAMTAETPTNALLAAVAGLGYRAALADSPNTPPHGGLLDRVREWVGGGSQAGHGNDKLHIAVIGSGGAARAAAPKAGRHGS